MKNHRLNAILSKIERISLRKVFLAFAVSFSCLMFTSTYLLNGKMRRELYFKAYRNVRNMYSPGRKNVVILLTNRRSGSTFLGEILQQNLNSFYLFEPLLPYTTSCDRLGAERVETLTQMLRCNFNNVSDAFDHAFKETRYPDNVAKCIGHTLCFVDSNKHLLDGYAKLCDRNSSTENNIRFEPESERCGYPLKPQLLSTLCKSASMVAFKVVRICSLEMLEPLYKQLVQEGHRVFIIHLVRDPRSILASTLNSGLDGTNKTNIGDEANSLCERMRHNLDYVEMKSRESKSALKEYAGRNAITDGRYTRIRFEDLALNAVKISREIYRFMDEELPPEVEEWISKSQYSTADIWRILKRKNDLRLQNRAREILNEMFKPFTTVRDPRNVIAKWRWTISYDMAIDLQSRCSDVIERLGYRTLNNRSEFINFTLSFHDAN